jgi:3-deoxy-D-arabino-heptulosonate 7-phosphate (DAHP) synthase class II
MKTPDHQAWNPTSWQTRPAQQQPAYGDPSALADAVAKLSRLPPMARRARAPSDGKLCGN